MIQHSENYHTMLDLRVRKDPKKEKAKKKIMWCETWKEECDMTLEEIVDKSDYFVNTYNLQRNIDSASNTFVW